MADLIAGTGITRGSLYNAFGGKEQLFIKSLQKYDRDNRAASCWPNSRPWTIHARGATMFEVIVRRRLPTPGRRLLPHQHGLRSHSELR